MAAGKPPAAVTLVVYVAPQFRHAVKMAAAEAGTNVSDYVRAALESDAGIKRYVDYLARKAKIAEAE